MTDTPTPTSATQPPAGTFDRLLEVRDLLRSAMDTARPSSLAGLVKEYRNVLAALDGLRQPVTVSALDDLMARRESRLAARRDS